MQLSLQKGFYMPDYEAEKAKCTLFLTTFEDPSMKEDAFHGKLKYMVQMQKVANKEADVIEVEVEDIHEFFNTAKDVPFVERVLLNTSRYVSLFSQVVDRNMPSPTINFKDDDLSSFDVIMQQRKFNMN